MYHFFISLFAYFIHLISISNRLYHYFTVNLTINLILFFFLNDIDILYFTILRIQLLFHIILLIGLNF